MNKINSYRHEYVQDIHVGDLIPVGFEMWRSGYSWTNRVGDRLVAPHSRLESNSELYFKLYLKLYFKRIRTASNCLQLQTTSNYFTVSGYSGVKRYILSWFGAIFAIELLYHLDEPADRMRTTKTSDWERPSIKLFPSIHLVVSLHWVCTKCQFPTVSGALNRCD